MLACMSAQKMMNSNTVFNYAHFMIFKDFFPLNFKNGLKVGSPAGPDVSNVDKSTINIKSLLRLCDKSKNNNSMIK